MMHEKIPQRINSPRDGEDMRLVWHDEFDGDRLDETKWNLFNRMWNQGVVFPTEDEKNIAVENGEVVMRTYRESEGT